MKALPRIAPLIAALLLIAVPAMGQGTTGSLNGSATQEGTPLPGVTVTITSPAMQGTRVTVTNVNGDYNFPALNPGDYTVKFEMQGMGRVKKRTKAGFGKTERVNAAMQLSVIAESIVVTASAPAVLETTEVQSNYDSKVIENLPMGRTLNASVLLAPGVSGNVPGATTGGQGVVIGGGYGYDSLFLINGAVTNENVRGQTATLFIEDAIQETTVMTGSISAEYGRFTGGVVSAITKSGGNDFSGSFRDSFTNPSWTATTPLGGAKSDSTLVEVYEATLGGRIIRDRLWFFAAGRSAEVTNVRSYAASTDTFETLDTDDRWEGKLTGQITQKHSLVASYLDRSVDNTPYCPFGCWEDSAIDQDGRQTPEEMTTARYNGILTSNLLLEAGYSARKLTFVGGGGDYITTDPNDAMDLALGTAAFDNAGDGAGWGSPVFCGTCDDKIRENEYYDVKGTYYLSTASTGTHNLVAGYQNFSESRYENNYQSGSNYMIYGFYTSPERGPDGTVYPIIGEGDQIVYAPVPTLAQPSDFTTESIFINDKWDLNTKWSFNLGLRYDKNDGVDSAGNPISKDSNTSPRVGVIYDVNGDGRFRVNGSYSKYVSKVTETIGGAGGGGNPWYIYYDYNGDAFGGVDSGLTSYEVLDKLFTWFLDQGGLAATDLISFARVPGYNTRIEDMKSPSVDEWTIGAGAQIGEKGYFRADFITREWKDFYVLATEPGDQVENPIVEGSFLDVVTTTNDTGELERSYDAIQMQASYRFSNRFSLAGNYTWSEATGNTEGESFGLGPFGDQIASYKEYKAFKQHNPSGYLPNDQTHKARVWLSYDQPIGRAGALNFSLLERFDSGTPYSARANVRVSSYVTNPGYASRPTRVMYYFSDRGDYRWDTATATDLAVNWSLPIWKTEFFIQGEVLNVFDESAQVSGNTTVSVIQDFNPFTETPVEGVNWVKGSSFGQATSINHYQTPITYRFSAGIRF